MYIAMPLCIDRGLKIGNSKTTQGSWEWYKCRRLTLLYTRPLGYLICTMVFWQHACSFLAALPLIDAAAFFVRESSNGLRVDTSSGAVQGFYNNTSHTVRAFLGVPFAAAPTSSLRFMPPVEREPSDDVIQATSWPPACPGIYTNETNIYSLLPYFPFAGFDEDCLTVNIWTPSVSRIKQNGNKLLPVMIYIYGGGFDQGGTSISTYEATDLVANHGDVGIFHQSLINSGKSPKNLNLFNETGSSRRTQLPSDRLR